MKPESNKARQLFTKTGIKNELLRMGKGQNDLSDMFVVHAGYLERADNYIRRQGGAAFGQGAETHDAINLIRKYGIVPQSVYSGFPAGQDKPVHGEMEAVLKGIVDALNKMPDGKLSPQWRKAYAGALDGDSAETGPVKRKPFKQKRPRHAFASLPFICFMNVILVGMALPAG